MKVFQVCVESKDDLLRKRYQKLFSLLSVLVVAAVCNARKCQVQFSLWLQRHYLEIALSAPY